MTGPAPMTEVRETALLAHVETLGSVAEAHAFRDALRDGGEALTSGLYAALLARIDLLQRREGRSA